MPQTKCNDNVYFYREFIKKLKVEMMGNPKGHMRDRSFSMSGYKDKSPGFSPETRIEMPTPEPSSTSPDPPEKEKSQYLLRIEREQRLMPGLRGRNRGRGRGRGGRGGRAKGRKRR